MTPPTATAPIARSTAGPLLVPVDGSDPGPTVGTVGAVNGDVAVVGTADVVGAAVVAVAVVDVAAEVVVVDSAVVVVAGTNGETMMSNEAVPMFPATSPDVQVTVVVPGAKVDPDGGKHVTGRLPSTLSTAIAVYATVAPLASVEAALTGAGGTATTGGVVSLTVTWNVAEPTFIAASVAVHVTVVEPIANVDPDDGAHTAGSDPSTASFAVAVKVTTAPVGPVASTFWLEGTVTTGGTVSSGDRADEQSAAPMSGDARLGESESISTAVTPICPTPLDVCTFRLMFITPGMLNAVFGAGLAGKFTNVVLTPRMVEVMRAFVRIADAGAVVPPEEEQMAYATSASNSIVASPMTPSVSTTPAAGVTVQTPALFITNVAPTPPIPEHAADVPLLKPREIWARTPAVITVCTPSTETAGSCVPLSVSVDPSLLAEVDPLVAVPPPTRAIVNALADDAEVSAWAGAAVVVTMNAAMTIPIVSRIEPRRRVVMRSHCLSRWPVAQAVPAGGPSDGARQIAHLMHRCVDGSASRRSAPMNS